MPRKRTAAPPGEEDWIKDAAVAAAETAIEQGGMTGNRTPSEVQVSSSEADTKPADSTPSTPEPLVISLTGLRTFRTPRKASVLFADPTDTTGRLQALGERLRELFMTAGYIIDEGRPLTLHATVIRMGSSKAGQGKEKAKTAAPEAKGAGARAEVPESKVTPAAARKRKRAQPATLDATELIEEFRDFVWAEEIRVERVAICKMGAKKIIGEGGEVVDEEYEVVEAVDIPAGWL
ncbi:hypothetical protein EJ06DRAFT_552366 [Trichodelitschia bisporula]|uniref:A-kinase anchor protein 7-like phosphoesterase domain-containing protein n=1 Tax=Trichodelitschia bisporula TaxID=703511 RepID=A0A6G1I9A5_9PEZI|nr:hypothetical protein EJ06DRAFT_552366 [Trichodelitschia bisporula]